MQYFRSYIVEGVAESWVEAEMSWVEVGGGGWRWMELGGAGWSWVELGARFSNTPFYLKDEIILIVLCQKEKRSKMFQVKAITKDVRKTIVPSFMFLFNLSTSVVLCVKKM